MVRLAVEALALFFLGSSAVAQTPLSSKRAKKGPIQFAVDSSYDRYTDEYRIILTSRVAETSLKGFGYFLRASCKPNAGCSDPALMARYWFPGAPSALARRVWKAMDGGACFDLIIESPDSLSHESPCADVNGAATERGGYAVLDVSDREAFVKAFFSAKAIEGRFRYSSQPIEFRIPASELAKIEGFRAEIRRRGILVAPSTLISP